MGRDLVFAPTLFAPHAPSEWPEVIAVDDLPFAISTGAPGGRPIFSVLGAVGYYGGQPRLIRVEAFPSASRKSWTQFFAALPGATKRIVTDQAKAILAAIPAAWPKPDTPEITFCHYHLRERLGKLLPASMGSGPYSLRAALEQAFRSYFHWDAFTAMAYAARLPKLHDWLDRHGKIVRRQIARGLNPRSAGALKTELVKVRERIGLRRFNFRNRERRPRGPLRPSAARRTHQARRLPPRTRPDPRPRRQLLPAALAVGGNSDHVLIWRRRCAPSMKRPYSRCVATLTGRTMSARLRPVPRAGRGRAPARSAGGGSAPARPPRTSGRALVRQSS